MTENQEQKSQSENTEEQKVSNIPEIVTEEMAAPFRSIVNLDYQELRDAFDEYWEISGPLIERKFKFKGKKVKGGKAKKSKEYLEKTVGCTTLYGEVLWHTLVEKLNRPLFFTNIKLERFDPERTFAVCVYYKRPTVTLKEDLNFDLERKAKYDSEKAWETRCKELQKKYQSVSPCTGEADISEDQQVLLDLTASCEGEPYFAASAQRMWFDVKDIAIKTLRDELTNHKKGDLFEISFENEEGKRVDVQVKVHDVANVMTPEVDDELARDAGFDDLEALKKQFYEEYNQYVKNAEESQACDHILTEIIAKAEFGPIPTEYIKLNTDATIKNFINNHRGDKHKAMKAIGATDEAMMQQLFVGQVHRDLYQKLARDYYAETYDLNVEDTSSILEDMRNRINWIDKKDDQG